MSAPATPARPFYVTGGTLKPGEPSYVERRADAELYESLLAGELCYVLTARQTGKSSLMARTAHRLEQSAIASAIVDLTRIGSERGDQAAAQWYFGIANLIHRQLAIEAPLRPWWQERADLSLVQRLTDFFHDIVLAHMPSRIVIFIDEIDSTIGLPFADDFFAALRVCFNARAFEEAFERLTFVLLGVATPDQLTQDPAHTPFNIGKRIDLTDFRLDEAQVLAPGLHDDPGKAGRRLERVLHWSGGHPYLTQALCRAVREQGADGTAEAAVDLQVEELFFNSRGQREETNLKHLRVRLERRGPEGRRLLQLYRRVRLGKPVQDQPTSRFHAQLKLSGIVKTTDDGRLAVRNRIYEAVFTPDWAKSAMPVDRGYVLAAATLAASLVGFLVWYAVFQPLANETALRTAIQDNANNVAQEAYNALRANPFSSSRAAGLMAQFWERKALRYALAGKRDRSLLCYLQALSLKDDPTIRRRVKNLVGLDYERLRATLRHPEQVRDLAFSSDGKVLRIVPWSGGAWSWDVRTARLLSEVDIPDASATLSAALSPDGRVAATAFSDRTVLWDAQTGKQLALLQEKILPFGLALVFSPDGRTLATNSFGFDGVEYILDASKEPNALLQFLMLLQAIAKGGSVTQLWDSRTGRPFGPQLYQENLFNAMAFSSDGLTLATASGDILSLYKNVVRKLVGQSKPQILSQPLLLNKETDKGSAIRLWDVHTKKFYYSVIHVEGHATALTFSPGAQILAAGSLSLPGVGPVRSTANLWSVPSGKPVLTPLRFRSAVMSLAFSPNSQSLATGESDGSVRFWDVHSGKPFAQVLQHNGAVRSMVFSPDGRTFAVVPHDGTARLWDADFGRSGMATSRYPATAFPLALSPDGKTLAMASADNVTEICDARTGERRVSPLQHQEGVSAAAFSPDGEILATAAGDKVRLWGAQSGRLLTPSLKQDKGSVTILAFSPDGQILATASSLSLYLWDARTGVRLKQALKGEPDHGANAMAFSFDGRTFAAVTDNNLNIWSLSTGALLAKTTLELTESPQSLAFSLDGKELALATRNWLTTFSWTGKEALPRQCQRLHGAWTGAFRYPPGCARCVEAALEVSGNGFDLESIQFDEPADLPIQGDPGKLLELWQARLGLRFDKKMNLIPEEVPASSDDTFGGRVASVGKAIFSGHDVGKLGGSDAISKELSDYLSRRR